MPTNFAVRLRPAQGVDPRFACYLLASLYAAGWTRAAMRQTTGIQNLDIGTFLARRVAVPIAQDQKQ
jgi:type I restriction enzyme, S subunit